MDSIIQLWATELAVVGALGPLVAAVGVLAKLIRSERLFQGVLVALLLGTAPFSAVGAYFLIDSRRVIAEADELGSFAPSMQPGRFETDGIGSDAKLFDEARQRPPLEIVWWKLKEGAKEHSKMEEPPTPAIGTGQLYFFSRLTNEHDLSSLRFAAFRTFDLSSDNSIGFMVNSMKADVVRLTLVDKVGSKDLVKLKLHKGWGGYAVSMHEFDRIDRRRIKTIAIERAIEINSVETNTLYVSYLGMIGDRRSNAEAPDGE
jgi:hypothetical protein